MRRISRKKALRTFRHMWRWLAKKTEKWDYPLGRSDYYDYMFIPECLKPAGIFFCCDYVHRKYENDLTYTYCQLGPTNCGDFCPIDWGAGHTPGYTYVDCMSVTYPSGEEELGYFWEWQRAYNQPNPQEAAKLAKIISELPEKEGV